MVLLSYRSFPLPSFYDGQSSDDSSDGAASDPQDRGESPVEPSGEGDQERTFTQADVNKFLAEDRRKHQEKISSLETSYNQLLENQNLSQEERTKLETELEELRTRNRTKEQQDKHERKKLEEEFQSKLSEATEAREAVWNLYQSEKITREIQDAAVTQEAYNPSQIVNLLMRSSSLKEVAPEDGKSTGQFQVMIEFADKDAETGGPITSVFTPSEAVRRMKELTKDYGNLFKSGVVSGLGGNSLPGGTKPGSGGTLTAAQKAKLSPAEYRRIRKEQPELLGM